jgi:predicted SprT family Zn-dependent metalloprotease
MIAHLDVHGHWVMPPRDAYLAAKVASWRASVPADLELPAETLERPFSPGRAEAELSTPTQRRTYFAGLVQEEMKWHGLLPCWRVVYDSARTRAGQCDFGNRTLSFSCNLVKRGTAAEMREIVLHEIAHGLAGLNHGHDHRWRRIAVRIGCTSGKRCPNFQLAKPRWLLCCSRGCWQVPRFKRSMSQLKQKCTECNAVCVYKTFH